MLNKNLAVIYPAWQLHWSRECPYKLTISLHLSGFGRDCLTDSLTRSEREIGLKIISPQFYHPTKCIRMSPRKGHQSYIRFQDSVLFC